MGDRYILTVICPKCGGRDTDAYYAPTCGIKTYRCPCGNKINLEKYSGINEADCSNAGLIKDIIKLGFLRRPNAAERKGEKR